MPYRYIDPETYPRKAHFAYFNSLSFPYVGVTVPVDITAFLPRVKENGWPFFLTFCYCVSRAANGVAEFRQRIVEGRIMEFESCRTSHTVALEDGTYCYCDLESTLPLEQYIPYARGQQARAKQQRSIAEGQSEALDKFFVSTLPWLSYTSLIQPVPMPADSNPRITWGKYAAQGDTLQLPVSVLCHHGLVDGIHIAGFYQLLAKELEAAAAYARPGHRQCESSTHSGE